MKKNIPLNVWTPSNVAQKSVLFHRIDGWVQCFIFSSPYPEMHSERSVPTTMAEVAGDEAREEYSVKHEFTIIWRYNNYKPKAVVV